MLAAHSLTVDGLERRTESGIDLVFRWRLRTDQNGLDQGSFRLTITGSDGDAVWTSGWVIDAAVTHRVTVPLAAGRPHWVRIDVRDGSGREGAGASAFLLTGPDLEKWQSPWIGRDPEPGAASSPTAVPTDLARSWQTMYSQPPLQLRRSFTLRGTPAFAALHISGRGVYRAFINGTQAGDEHLAPGWTDYESRIELASHDVTALLSGGENVLAAEVSDGWWSGYVGFDTRRHARLYGDAPQLVCMLEVVWSDGSSEIIDTTEGWKEKPGSIVMADLLMGEYHDLGLETPGWDCPGFDDAGWRDAAVLDHDLSTLVVASGPPVRALLDLPALSVRQVGNAQVVDFGQNLVGHVRLRLRSQPAGAVIRIRHGEMLEGEAVYTANLRTAEALDIIALGDAGSVEFEPHHTVHGFRYASLEGVTGTVALEDIDAVVVGTDLPQTGRFSTSSELIDQLYSNIRWGQTGNFVAVPTDCPQRDERLGWTADTQIFAPTALFNSDAAGFLRRWLVDLRTSQGRDGSVPDVIPLPPHTTGFSWGAPAWGDAVTLVPWAIYRVTGDESVLAEALESMRRWSDYTAARAPRGLWETGRGNDYGDWLSVEAVTDPALVATAYYAHSSEIAARAAAILDDADQASVFRARAEEATAAFQGSFLSEDGLIHPTQTGCLMALAWDLVPAGLVPLVRDQLIADIESRSRRLTTGFLGVALLCPVLAAHGRSDLAYALLLQEEYPSWGYSIRHGATTIWERWDGWTEEHGFQSISMNSFNHYSLGSVGEWLYRGVAGIDQAPGDAGFTDLVIRPYLTDRLDAASAEFLAPRGLIRSGWRRQESGDVEMSVEIPPGCTARVHVGREIVQVGSGRHSFTVHAVDAMPQAADE